VRALRHPALGLALVMLGISSLPGRLVQISNLWSLFETAPPMAILAPLVSSAVLAAFQVATGWAITRQRYAGILFAGYVLACFAVTIATALTARGDETFSPAVALGAVVETFGLPVLIAIASLRYPEELEDTRAFRDVSGALFVLALNTFIMVPLTIASLVRMTHGASVSVGSWVGLLIDPLVLLAVGVFAAIGTRNQPSARLYIIVSTAVALAMSVLAIGWTFAEGGNEMVRRFVIASRLLHLVALTLPAVLWLYLHSPTGERQASRVPMWIAISYVPLFIGRMFISSQVAAQFGHVSAMWVITIAIALAIILLAMGDAVLRALPAARAWAIAATVIGALLLVAGAIFLFKNDREVGRHAQLGLLAPLAYLIASTIGAAVYSRR
jgi:hypothetical protein